MVKRGPSKPSALARFGVPALVIVLKTIWVAFVIATPLLGAWLSSSTAAYSGGSVGLAAAIGVLLFPVLPGLWEGFAEWRYRRAKAPKPRILTRGDRVLLRTLALNLAFLIVMVGWNPRSSFRALATRGDWMLDGAESKTAESVRKVLFGTAERLTWLYEATDSDPYAENAKKKKDGTTPAPMPKGDTLVVQDPERPEPPVPDPKERPTPAPGKEFDRDRPWPSGATPHPLAEHVPAADEASIDALAKFIVAQESDPMKRFKLLHDWVATHVDYDVPMLSAPRITEQEAETVFTKRKGVCAGYSRLMEELGKKAGFAMTFVSGHARVSGDEVDGERHAWNIVEIEGKKYLVDATWDAGYVGDEGGGGQHFTRRYTSDYLFTPPDVFGIKHFPQDPKLQLMDSPVSRGEFFRQPMMSPGFFAAGFKLVSPNRSQVTAKGGLSMIVEGSESGWLMVDARSPGLPNKRCEVSKGARFDVSCSFPSAGKYEVNLFYGPQRYGSYESVGSIAVINDP